MLNNQGPRYKRSALEKRMNRDVIWCVVILLFICLFGAIGSGVWMSHFEDTANINYISFSDPDRFNPAYQGFLVFWTYIIIFQVMIPLPLYVSIELVKLGQAYFISQDQEMYYEKADRPMECRALNITEELGQVQYVFTDKTGTLTENKMVFKKCSIGGKDYPHPDEFDDHGNFTEIQPHPDHVTVPNMALHHEVSMMSLHTLDSVQIEVPYPCKRIHDFFLLMAVCNTVFVSPHSHLQELFQSSMDVRNYCQADNHYNSSNHISRNSSGIEVDVDVDVPDADCSPHDQSKAVLSIDTLKTRYEAESPDELALVYAACSYGCRLLKRSANSITVWLPAEGNVEMDLLHVLPFDSDRKRMSVIVRNPLSAEVVLYCKGADMSILNNLSTAFKDVPDNVQLITNTVNHINQYAKDGLRTLCMAKRKLSDSEYQEWLLPLQEAERSLQSRDSKLFELYCKIETDMELLGATGVEDRLQDGVPETIASLRTAGINVWILTGDKQETAINIAYSCKLISYEQEVIILNAPSQTEAAQLLELHLEQTRRCSSTKECQASIADTGKKGSIQKQANVFPSGRDLALIVDGQTLTFLMSDILQKQFLRLSQKCQSVVCCRATPGQKASIVKMVRDRLSKLTLAIGDGANDVSMIQTAGVGVGIAGEEGMQAVMASDFAIGRFRFLERLLLVHGHWCYDRLTRMSLYMFYKNSAFVFLLFWYQLFNGFSGTTMMDQYYLILYSLIFTSVPPIVVGIFDRDAPADILLSTPQLYKQGLNSKMYMPHSYWVNIADALYQSLVMFFVPYMSYAGGEAGIWEFGTTTSTCAVVIALLHMGIETKSWTYVNWLAVILSAASFWLFTLGFNAWCVTCSNSGFEPYWVMEHTLLTAVHWFTVVLTSVVAVLPRLSIRALQGSFLPPAVLFAKWWTRFDPQPLQEDDDVHVVYSSNENECTLNSFRRKAEDGESNIEEVTSNRASGEEYIDDRSSFCNVPNNVLA